VWITLAALKGREVIREADAVEAMMKRAIALVH